MVQVVHLKYYAHSSSSPLGQPQELNAHFTLSPSYSSPNAPWLFSTSLPLPHPQPPLMQKTTLHSGKAHWSHPHHTLGQSNLQDLHWDNAVGLHCRHHVKIPQYSFSPPVTARSLPLIHFILSPPPHHHPQSAMSLVWEEIFRFVLRWSYHPHRSLDWDHAAAFASQLTWSGHYHCNFVVYLCSSQMIYALFLFWILLMRIVSLPLILIPF